MSHNLKNIIIIGLIILGLSLLYRFGKSYVESAVERDKLLHQRDSLMRIRDSLLQQLQNISAQDSANQNTLNYAKEIRYNPGAIDFYELPLSSEYNSNIR